MIHPPPLPVPEHIAGLKRSRLDVLQSRELARINRKLDAAIRRRVGINVTIARIREERLEYLNHITRTRSHNIIRNIHR